MELNLLKMQKYHETKIQTTVPVSAVDRTAGAIERPYTDQYATRER
jgi:hypothetical protein